MQKNSSFLWSWNDRPAQPDLLMTRQRAARLLRSWRRGSRLKANGGPTFSLRRNAKGDYSITHLATGERARLVSGSASPVGR